MLKNLLLILFYFLPVIAIADESIPSLTNTTPKDIYRPALPDISPIDKQPSIQQKKTTKTNLNLTSAELLQNPEFLEKILDTAAWSRNKEALELLLPLYSQLQQKNQILLLTAQATLAELNGNYEQAIINYNKILQEDPNLKPIQFNLATSLFNNKAYVSADQYFKALQQDNELPDEIRVAINSYIDAIQQLEKWDFSVNGRYLAENNVNNAPDKKTIKEFEQETGGIVSGKEKAHGIGFYIGTTKNWILKDGVISKLNLATFGKWYWDNHAYDDISTYGSLGLSFQNAQQELNILPQLSQRWFGTKPYSTTAGLRLEYNHQIHPKWLLLTAYEINKNQYHDFRKYLNGKTSIASGTAVYIRNPDQYWLLGSDLIYTTTRDKEDTYFDRGLRIGWGQNWSFMNLSTQLNAGFSQRDHKGINMFNIIQKDHNYSLSLLLWNRKLHFKNIIPKLYLGYSERNSNTKAFSYKKYDIFITLQKQF